MHQFWYYSEGNRSSQTYIGSANYQGAGQAFTGNGHQLVAVKFWLSKLASPTGSAYAKLYAHSGTYGSTSVPTGSPLATSDAFDVSTLGTSYALAQFNFSTPYTVANGTYYVVTIEYAGGDSTNKIVLGIGPLGTANNSVLTAGSWSSQSFTVCCRLFDEGTDGLEAQPPTGDGDNTATVTVYPASPTTKFDKVDDGTPGTPDDDSTYIYFTAVGRWLFTFTALSVPSGATISRVTVYYRHKKIATQTCDIASSLKVGGNYYDATDPGINPTNGTWNTRQYDYTVNPKTGVAWTVDDVNGVGTNALQQFGLNSSDIAPNPYCTECYIEVAYTTYGGDYNESISLSATGSVALAQFIDFNASIGLAASSTIGPDPASSIFNADALLTASAFLTDAGIIDLLTVIDLAAMAGMQVSGGMSFEAAVALAAAAGLLSSVNTDIPASLTLTANAAIFTATLAIFQSAVNLAAASGISLAAVGDLFANLNLTASAGLTTQAQNLLNAILTLAASAGVTTAGDISAGVYYEAIQLLTAPGMATQATKVLEALVGLSATPSLGVDSLALLNVAILLLSAAALSIAGEVPGGEIVDVLITLLRRRRR